jgi:signal transduction histidine kinase
MRDLSLHLLDIAQNSIAAQATKIDVHLEINTNLDYLALIISDNGKGMNAEFLQQITSPFTTTRTTRKVGLGLPLLMQNAERTGGYLEITSSVGKGTTLRAVFHPNHIDCPPMGDIAGVAAQLICSFPNISFSFSFKTDTSEFSITTLEIAQALEGIPINDTSVFPLVKQVIESSLEELKFPV